MAGADADLLREIEKFLALADMSASAFGSAAIGDPNLVGDMRRKDSPRSPSGRTATKVREFITRETRKLRRRSPAAVSERRVS